MQATEIHLRIVACTITRLILLLLFLAPYHSVNGVNTFLIAAGIDVCIELLVHNDIARETGVLHEMTHIFGFYMRYVVLIFIQFLQVIDMKKLPIEPMLLYVCYTSIGCSVAQFCFMWRLLQINYYSEELRKMKAVKE